ncbi:MAG TPA: hypothetical protein VEJ87_13650 [Acidimicrobiales bacterium]|nr:hypothetical protein [Acidimicrobiales bacterium]
MRLRKKEVVAVVAIAGLLLAGASAFTAANTFTNSNTTVGYGSENVTGATVSAIDYTLSADGTTITAVTLVTVGDTSGSAAAVGFTVGGTALPTSACGAGTYASGPNATTYSCTGLSQLVSTVQATDVVVD